MSFDMCLSLFASVPLAVFSSLLVDSTTFFVINKIVIMIPGGDPKKRRRDDIDRASRAGTGTVPIRMNKNNTVLFEAFSEALSDKLLVAVVSAAV
jgi:hypothetical protein